jgi:hypothetical protein
MGFLTLPWPEFDRLNCPKTAERAPEGAEIPPEARSPVSGADQRRLSASGRLVEAEGPGCPQPGSGSGGEARPPR